MNLTAKKHMTKHLSNPTTIKFMSLNITITADHLNQSCVQPCQVIYAKNRNSWRILDTVQTVSELSNSGFEFSDWSDWDGWNKCNSCLRGMSMWYTLLRVRSERLGFCHSGNEHDQGKERRVVRWMVKYYKVEWYLYVFMKLTQFHKHLTGFTSSKLKVCCVRNQEVTSKCPPSCPQVRTVS